MGFFDSLKKIVNAAETVSKQLNTSTVSSSSNRTSTASSDANVKKTLQSVLDSGSIPAKPSVKRETATFGGEDANDEFNVSFMLSGDFIEFDSHCELDPSFQYEPESNEDFTDYDERLPSIVIGPDVAPGSLVYDAAEKYLKEGAVCGRDFEKIDNGTFLFRTKFDYPRLGMLLYAYVFSDKTVWGHQMLGLQYNKDIEGTPLEKKLMAALDEAASTYTETKIN